MKYLIWLFVVLAALWWLRLQRRNTVPRADARSQSNTQSMVACAHCGVHVPEGDAWRGSQGVYCSDAHRQRHEG